MLKKLEISLFQVTEACVKCGFVLSVFFQLFLSFSRSLSLFLFFLFLFHGDFILKY